MTEQIETTPAELPCDQCEYDLRAHPPDGTCPECGASVAESRRVATIPRRPAWRDSDPRWRRRILAGVLLLLLVPLMDVLEVFGWSKRIPMPELIDLYGAVRTLNDTSLAWQGLYASLVLCMGLALVFSRERGRRPSRLDWTRRWGLICTYVVLLLNTSQFLFIASLVAVGISALFLSIPPDYQPSVTHGFAMVSSAWLRYGPQPKEVAGAVQAGFASVAVLLACVPLYDALRSCGPKRAAAFLLAPLAFFSVVHLAQAGMHAVGLSSQTDADIYFLGLYFRPGMLLGHLAGKSTGWPVTGSMTLMAIIEVAKWCVLLAAAGWLIIGRFAPWGHGVPPK